MDAPNFQSLNVVRDELVATIEESARHLELFVNSQDDSGNLQACINGIRQIVGILRLIQFEGAATLGEELLAVAMDIAPGNSGPKYEKRLELVSGAFFVLTRYLEYVKQIERKVPVLLIPYINELRKLRGELAYPESHFFEMNLNRKITVPPVESHRDLGGQSLNSVVRRLRQMYQVGLLGLIRERQLKNSLGLMRRCLIRLHRLSGSSKPLAQLWWMGNLTLDVFIQKEMTLTEARKRLFGRIDRIIRRVEMAGESSFSAEPPKGLIKELIYLLVLSGSESEEIKNIREVYGLTAFPYCDADLAREREALNGPSAHTVSSLARVLQLELSNTKKILENAAQAATQRIDDLHGFVGTLDKVADILAVVGLVTPSNTLKSEISRIVKWKDLPDGPDSEALDEVANTLLYLESTVTSLEHTKLSYEKLDMANKIAQQEVIATGELTEAKKIVIEECEAGLSLTKRALSSYSDSNYDPGHIRNIVKTLSTIRGGMLMLKNVRAANVLFMCSRFVEEVLMDQDRPAAMKELLETFADVIIAVEYYLDSATGSLVMDDSVLQIAEESLQALGYPVTGQG